MVSSMSCQITLAGVADFEPAAFHPNASPLVITIHRERRHMQGEPAPWSAANIAVMAARQPVCLSAAITEPAGTAQSAGTPRAAVPSRWDGTELVFLTRHKLQTGCPAVLFIDY